MVSKETFQNLAFQNSLNFASYEVLSEEWLSEEEDKAWGHLQEEM
jgi:hypothetical protein